MAALWLTRVRRHVTVLDSDKIIYNENPNFHVNIQMEDDDANLIDVVSDVDATPILDAKLKAKDTVRKSCTLRAVIPPT